MDQAARNARGAGGLLAPPPKCNLTFCLIKPDAVRRGLVGTILADLEQDWFNLCRLEMTRPTRSQVEAHYVHHAGTPYFAALVDFMCSGALVACVLHSRFADLDAVVVLRNRMGPWDRPAPWTLRGKLMRPGDPPQHNLIHGADSLEEAAREAAIWFPGIDFFHC